MTQAEQKTAETQDDVLLSCLSILCELEHHEFSTQTAIAGLPLVNNKLTPSLFVRAAARLGFSARVMERQLSDISTLVLPAVLVLKNNRACVLKSITEDGKLELISPETGGGESLHELEELEQEYSGYVIFVQPDYRFDERASSYNVVKKTSWFWGTLWHYRQAYFQVAIAALIVNLFALCSPLFVMNVYDRVVPNQAMETLWVLAIGMAIIIVFDFLLRTLRGFLIDKVGKKADILLASKLFERVMGLQLSGRPTSAGAFANNLREFEVLRDAFTSSTLTLLIDLPFIFLFIWIISIIAGKLALVPLFAVPIVLVAAFLAEIPLRQSVQKSILGATQKHAVLVESINSLSMIKGLNAEGLMQRRWEQYVSATAQASLASRFFSSLAVNFTLYTTQMVTVITIIFGVYLIKAGELSMGGLIATSLLSGRALAPLAQIANIVTRIQQSTIALKGLNKLMNAPQERPDGRRFLPRADIKGQITFDKVTFSYPEQPMAAIDNMSFNIMPGERVGIIGRIGSGKSSITRLCMNYYQPSSGKIKIDGIDMAQLDPADLRRQIGYVAEESYLFYGSLRDNIAMGKPTADHDTILHAAEMAGIGNFIKQHPLGLDMLIGERGEGLSSGQQQAVSLARCLIRDPRILLLDEPTSHLDSSSEAFVIQQLREFTVGRTMILVTHKMSLLDIIDRLIVLDGGRIVADGPKDKVIEALKNNQPKANGNVG